MRMRAPWRSLCIALGALALLLSLPEFASAQANALFPDIYIKRQRPCPSLEDPRYRYIRENYFGYFPTCWRRFPPGWGCPSPDAPNWEAELRRLPLEVPEDLAAPAPGVAAPGERVEDPFIQRRPTAPRPGEGALPELPPEEPVFPRPGAPPERPPGAPPGGPEQPGPAPSASADTPEPPQQPAENSLEPSPLFTRPAATANAVPIDLEEPPALAPPAPSVPLIVPEALPSASNAGQAAPTMTRAPQRRGILSGLMGRLRRR